MGATVSDTEAALLIWLPAGTIVPFIVSWLTGADWRGAIIEASFFAALGLLIYPTALGLISARFTSQPNVELLFVISFALALGSVLLFRRSANRTHHRFRKPK